jgi:hypothetical protein
MPFERLYFIIIIIVVVIVFFFLFGRLIIYPALAA